MTPLEKAMLDSILAVEQDISRRSAAKQVSETLEDFSDKSKSFNNLGKIEGKEKFYAVRENANFKIENLQEVEGGFVVKDIVLLEDGLIPRRVLFEKGAMKAGFDKFQADEPNLLVNDSHNTIEESLLLGSLGSITKMRLEKFGDNNDKGRLMVDVFLDGENPATKWLLSLGGRMNKVLSEQGKEFNIFSVSAEVRMRGLDIVDFAGSFVLSAEEVEVLGMGIVFNPANISSFGTVDSLKSRKSLFLGEADEVQKSPIFNFLKKELMSKKDENLKKTEEELQAEELRKQEALEEEKKKEEEGKGEDEGGDEDGKDEGGDDEEGEGEGDEGEDGDDEEEEGKGDESADKSTADTLKELLKSTKTAIELAESLKEDNQSMKKEIEELRTTLDKSGDGNVLSRTPNGKKAKKLSLAQTTARDGNKSQY